MLIIFIRKNKNADAKNQNITDDKAVRKHNEEMKKFSLSHPKIKEKNGKEPIAAENLLLLPVQGVKLGNNSQN